MSKLTLSQVKLIFKLRKQGHTQSEIGRKFGVCQAHISDVLSGRRRAWRNLLKAA